MFPLNVETVTSSDSDRIEKWFLKEFCFFVRYVDLWPEAFYFQSRRLNVREYSTTLAEMFIYLNRFKKSVTQAMRKRKYPRPHKKQKTKKWKSN